MTVAPEVGADHLTTLDVSPPDLVSVAREAGFDLVGLRLVAPRRIASAHNRGRSYTRRDCAPAVVTSVRVLSVEVVRVATGVLAQRLRTRRNWEVNAMDAVISLTLRRLFPGQYLGGPISFLVVAGAAFHELPEPLSEARFQGS